MSETQVTTLDVGKCNRCDSDVMNPVHTSMSVTKEIRSIGSSVTVHQDYCLCNSCSNLFRHFMEGRIL